MSTVSQDAIDAAAQAEATLISGTPDALMLGTRQLQNAAALGSPQAMTRLAHFKAAGVAEKADWDGALDLLERAAALNWPAAAGELRLLSRDKGATASERRANVDIRSWIAPRPTEIVSDSPRIRTISSFMSAAECAWMIALAAPKLGRAAVYDNRAAGTQVVTARTNTAAALSLLDKDIVNVFLTVRMANTIGLPSPHFEPASVLHYDPGEQFVPHFDFLSSGIPGQAEELRRGGQRIATFLTYLNEGYEGGETEFPRLNYRYKGRAGDALVFANVDASGAPDPRTMHAGRPPSRGEKWLLSQWVRDRVAA